MEGEVIQFLVYCWLMHRTSPIFFLFLVQKSTLQRTAQERQFAKDLRPQEKQVTLAALAGN